MTSLYLGWQYAMPAADPGLPPRPPADVRMAGITGAWLAAQRREERLITRPLRATAAAALLAALGLAASAAAGWLPGALAVAAAGACLLAAGRCGHLLWRGERALRRGTAAELLRARLLGADLERTRHADQAEHARLVERWRWQRSAFVTQKRWYAVPVPDGVDRVDVAGGTLAGWSALLTMTAAYHLAAGGEVTVLDLTGGAVASDVTRLAAAADGVRPAVWVLPGDLPRLDLTARLASAELADVLAQSVGAAEAQQAPRDLAVDAAVLDRVIGALDRDDDGALPVRRVVAALRAVAQVGDPAADLAAGLLTEREVGALGAIFGQGAAGRVVAERALGLEAHLRRLAGAGTDPAGPHRGRLRVIALDRRASPQSAAMLGSFAVTALTHLIGQAPPANGPTSWRHAVFLLGAERLRGDVLDRVSDACESAGIGLVLAYRSLPAHVRQRVGRGNAAVAFMRLGNADDARTASEQLGAAYRFVVSQLTETVGRSVTDTLGGSYTSTVGDSASAAASSSTSESRSAGTSRSRTAGAGPLPLPGGGSRTVQSGTSSGTSGSASLTAGITTSTAWGVSTSRATGDSESLARSLQRSRELVVEPSELQRLPATAMIVSHGSGPARRVLLADANPAIGGLPVATLEPLGDTGVLDPAPAWRPGRTAGTVAGDRGVRPGSAGDPLARGEPGQS